MTARYALETETGEVVKFATFAALLSFVLSRIEAGE